MENIEIERKWLMDGFPPLPRQRSAQMQQAYLCFAPNTVRIRRAQWEDGPVTYILCIKGKGTLCRTEVEMSLTQGQYEALLPLAAAPVANKELHTYALEEGLMLECSLVDGGDPTSFYYAEVEFESEEQALAFVPPAFLGREMTQEPGFTMAAYCRRKGGDC